MTDKHRTAPPIGTRPTLEWVTLDQLEVDETYQRAMGGNASQRVIAAMIKQWDWRLCQPLVVARRFDSDGGGRQRLMVVDGQHRLTGARERGDIDQLPCVIAPFSNVTDEAEAFVALNNSRARLTQFDLFNAAILARDPASLKVMELLHDAGLRHVRHANTPSWKPGDIHCGPMLARAIGKLGDQVVRNALTALAEAYPDKVVASGSTILKGLFGVYDGPALDADFDADDFIDSLKEIEPEDWDMAQAELRARHSMLSRTDRLTLAMLNNYRDYRGAKNER